MSLVGVSWLRAEVEGGVMINGRRGALIAGSGVKSHRVFTIHPLVVVVAVAMWTTGTLENQHAVAISGHIAIQDIHLRVKVQ